MTPDVVAEYKGMKELALARSPAYLKPDTDEAGREAMGGANTLLALAVLATRCRRFDEARSWASLGLRGCREHVLAFRPNLPTWPHAPPKGHGLWTNAQMFAIKAGAAPLLAALSSTKPMADGDLAMFREALQLSEDFAQWQLGLVREDCKRDPKGPPAASNDAARAWIWEVWVPALLLDDRPRVNRCQEALEELGRIDERALRKAGKGQPAYEYPRLSGLCRSYAAQDIRGFQEAVNTVWATYDSTEASPYRYQFQGYSLALCVWRGNPMAERLKLDLGGALRGFRPPDYWGN
jgi:hypothetical protein